MHLESTFLIQLKFMDLVLPKLLWEMLLNSFIKKVQLDKIW